MTELFKPDFAEVFEAYYDRIYKYAYTILLNRENAEDVTSEFFIKFWEKADSFIWENDFSSLEPHRYARYIYVVDELPGGNIKVTVGTGREMKDYVNFETDYSKVLIHEAYVDDMDLVIYQK